MNGVLLKVQLHSRHVAIDDDFREAAESKVAHAARFFEGAGDADVELSEEQNPRLAPEKYRVEITCRAGGHLVRVESASSTPMAALDFAVDRFEKQLRRLRDRMVQRSRQPRADKSEAVVPGEESEPEIVRVKQFLLKPMTAEEAILQLDMLGHEFFYFHNADTDLDSVLYRRRDGAYGLIEPR